MATHSSILAWTEEPGRLQSTGCKESDTNERLSLLLFTYTYKINAAFKRYTFFILHRAWLLTPVFLPGESHGQRSLAGYSPWGHKESDTTEQLTVCMKRQYCPYQLIFITHVSSLSS